MVMVVTADASEELKYGKSIFPHLSIKETENLIFSVVRLIFISLMNTKSGIFTRCEATRENTAFGVHSVK